MNFFESVFESIVHFFKAIPFTFRHFAWALFIPIIFFVILFYLTFSIEGSIQNEVSKWLISSLNIENSDNWFFLTLKYIIQGVLFILFKILFFLFFFFISGNVVLILLSPVLSYISEKTEKIISNKKYPFSVRIWIKQIGRSIVLALRNMLIQLLLTLVIFFVSFIPIIGWIISPFSIVLTILINSYFLGFSFLDFSFERKGLTIQQSVYIVRRNKGTAIGFGLIFFLLFMIPYLGNFLAPIVALFSVVGATLSVEKMKLYD